MHEEPAIERHCMCDHNPTDLKIREELDKNEEMWRGIVARVKELVSEADQATNEFNAFVDQEEKSQEEGTRLLQKVVATQSILLSMIKGYDIIADIIEATDKECNRIMDKMCEDYDVPPLHKYLNGKGCNKEKKWWQF